MDLGRIAVVSGTRRSQALAWLLAPVLGVLAALVTSTRGGMLIRDGVVRPMPWIDRFVTSLYEFVWWVVLAPLIVWLVQRVSTWRASTAMHAVAHLASAAAVCVLNFLLRSRIPLPGDATQLAPGWRGFLSVLPASVALYMLIAAGAALVMAVARARAREREAAELALRASRLETQLVEAQLGTLRAQLHPHFLFNALHAVSALIDVDPTRARRMLTRLSELLRMALEFSDEREISLARELDWLDRYLELQQSRFGDRLAVDIIVSGDSAGALVPPLLLQPLVENAIKHGIETRVGGGRVQVIAEHEGDTLRLRVCDDGPGPRAVSAAPGTGTGLRNTEARLRALYATNQQLVLRARDVRGGEVVVELPFRHATAAREGRERSRRLERPA